MVFIGICGLVREIVIASCPGDPAVPISCPCTIYTQRMFAGVWRWSIAKKGRPIAFCNKVNNLCVFPMTLQALFVNFFLVTFAYGQWTCFL